MVSWRLWFAMLLGGWLSVLVCWQWLMVLLGFGTCWLCSLLPCVGLGGIRAGLRVLVVVMVGFGLGLLVIWAGLGVW